VFALLVIPAWAADIEVPGIPNFHRVNEHVYRGGQPTERAWTILAYLGVKTIIDLRPAGEHSISTEAQAVEATKMHYVNVPMSGIGAPRDEDVSEVLSFLDSDSAWPVFVHCRHGVDRAGTVIACYRIEHDHWPNQEALKEAKALGLHWVEVGMRHYILNFKSAVESIAAESDLPAANRDK